MAIPVEIPLTALTNPFDNRRTVRQPVNPMDKSTVVSIFPKRIEERKWTIQPGFFVIEAGTYDKPAMTVVGPSSWWKGTGPDEPLLEIPVYSNLIADSIVKDYCNGITGCDMGESMPGLFWLPGSDPYNKEMVDIFKAELNKAQKRQTNWYRTLVKIADVYWARTNGNPVSIMDDMRLAARELGLDREWIKDFQAAEMVRCAACGSMKNSKFPVCPVCRAVDANNPAGKDLKFAV